MSNMPFGNATIEQLKVEREALAKRTSEINAAMGSVAKNDPRRPRMIGEQAEITARLKILNDEIKQRNIVKSASIMRAASSMHAAGDPMVAIGVKVPTRHDFAAMMALNMLISNQVHLTKDGKKLIEIPHGEKIDLGDIIDDAFVIADGMFPGDDTEDEAEDGDTDQEEEDRVT